MRTWLLVAALMVPAFLAEPACWAEDPTPESLFHEGWYKETGLKDLEGAIDAYEKVVERSKEAEAYAARAQFQIGVCLEKMGKGEEAQAAYKKVLDLYPEQQEWAGKAKEKLAGAKETPKDPTDQVIDKVRKTQISLNFQDAPLTDVLMFYREFTRINIILDAEVATPEDILVTMHVDNLPFDQALDLSLKMHDLDWCVEDGVVIVSTKEAIAKREEARKKPAESDADAAAWRAEMQRVMENTRIDLDFTDATLEDIIGFFREYARVNMEIDPAVRADGTSEKKVTLQLRDVTMKTALTLLCKQYGLTFEYVNHVILIKREGTPR